MRGSFFESTIRKPLFQKDIHEPSAAFFTIKKQQEVKDIDKV